MLASFVIVFREVLETGLIVGIVLAATQGIARRGVWIAGGILSGMLGAALLAACAGALANALAGVGQEVFTASVLVAASLMLGWHTLWMARHGREMAARLRAMGGEVAAGRTTLLAMAVVVGVAVLREGAEVALFLYGVAVSGQDGPVWLLAGGLLGIAAGVVVAWLLYRGLLGISVRRLFGVTGGLVSLLAAGMAGTAAATLAGAELIPTFGDQLWDTSGILPDGSLLGRALHAMVGYADRPPGVQVLAYLATLAALVLASRWVERAPSHAPARTALP